MFQCQLTKSNNLLTDSFCNIVYVSIEFTQYSIDKIAS